MSLTVMFFVAFFVLLALGIVAIVGAVASAKDGYAYKPTAKTWVISFFAALLLAAGVSAFVAGCQNYNDNTRESRQSCLDNGGVVYENNNFSACFAERPVELQRL